MNELERLIVEYGKNEQEYGSEAKEAYCTHYYMAVNHVRGKAQQAKQALLDYIEENYRGKDD